jgi:hypothetical protein
MGRCGVFMVMTLWLLAAGPATADIYRWRSADGVMHFSNAPPPAGVELIEKIEETPYDAAADRQRIEEERRLNLERQKLEAEERRSGVAAREREAQAKLDEAERRLQEAREVEQQAQEGQDEDCDDDYYLRYGTCFNSFGVYRYYRGRPGQPDLYRGYYRENNSLYYKPPHKPGRPPGPPRPHPPGVRPTPLPESPRGGSRSPAADELLQRGGGAGVRPPALPR